MSRRATLLGIAAVAAYVLATLAWVAGDRRAEREAFENPGSSLDRGASGTSLARAVLEVRAGGRAPVDALLRRIDLAEVSADAVVFRLAPPQMPFEVRWGEGGKGSEKKKAPADPEKKGEEPGSKKPKGPEGSAEKARKQGEAAKPSKGDDGKDEGGEEGEEEEAPAARNLLLTDGEEAWVQAGGRLVLAAGGSYGPLDVGGLPGKARVAKVFPLWPRVRRIEPRPARALAGPPLALSTVVFLAGDRPLVARLSLGRGEVILLACPEVFANERLGDADHLALLFALAGAPGERAVYFDEWSHGLERRHGTLSLLAAWGFGPALLLGLLAAAAAFWRARARVGPPEREDPDLRSDAVDLVDALGELYDRALRRVDALRVHYDNLVRTVAAETGLSGSALDARMALILPGFSAPPPGAPEISREELSRQLRIVNEAFGRIDVREQRTERRA